MRRSSPGSGWTSSSTLRRSSKRCATATSSAALSSTAKSSMKHDAGSEGRRWLAQAESDLAFAELAWPEPFFASACFHGQQAAEKALKAFPYAPGAAQILGPSIADLAAKAAKLEQPFIPLT